MGGHWALFMSARKPIVRLRGSSTDTTAPVIHSQRIQRQLGLASIRLTVDTYGKWLPIAAPEAASTHLTTEVVAAPGSTGRGSRK